MRGYFVIKFSLSNFSSYLVETKVSIEEETRLTAVICCNLKNKKKLDATYGFIILMIGSTCFGYSYAHHQELTTIVLITTLAFRFCLQPGHLSGLPAPNFQQQPKNRKANVVISTRVVSS